MSGEEAKQPEVAQEASAEPMEQEAAPAAAGTKRKAEEDPAAEGGEQPAAKAAKTGGAEAGEAAAEAGEAAEDAGGEAAAEEGGPATETSAPVQIGYKTFNSGKEAKAYYHNLISKLRKYQNLNDYEFHMVHELIKQGHPEAARKLEGGVRAIQIREVEIGHAVTACFFLIHDDGSDEDVSYRKCLGGLFPELAKEMASTGSGAKAGSRGGKSPGGRGRGRGRGRGGRGGRGGGGRGRN